MGLNWPGIAPSFYSENCRGAYVSISYSNGRTVMDLDLESPFVILFWFLLSLYVLWILNPGF